MKMSRDLDHGHLGDSLSSRPMTPNGIRIRSAVFPQCTGQPNRRTDRHTYRPTDRQIVHWKVWWL